MLIILTLVIVSHSLLIFLNELRLQFMLFFKKPIYPRKMEDFKIEKVIKKKKVCFEQKANQGMVMLHQNREKKREIESVETQLIKCTSAIEKKRRGLIKNRKARFPQIQCS